MTSLFSSVFNFLVSFFERLISEKDLAPRNPQEPAYTPAKKPRSWHQFWGEKIKKLGGNWVPGKSFWIVGVRSLEKNMFDDEFFLLYWEMGKAKTLRYNGTTDPGVPNSWFVAPNIAYNNLWVRGNRASFAKKLGTDECIVLRQDGSRICLLPDKNRDLLPDMDKAVWKDSQEYQHHFMSWPWTKPGLLKRIVGNWSLGCSGPCEYSDWEKIMAIIPENTRVGYVIFNKSDVDILSALGGNE